MTTSPIIAFAAGADVHQAVRDSLVQHGTALVFDPADSFPAFTVQVERRTLVVDRGAGSIGTFGSVKAAVRCGTRDAR